ncbi:MAG: hypothetical protein WCP97_00650 [bacterium]
MIIPAGKFSETLKNGTYKAVLFDVVDIGEKTSTFEGKEVTQRKAVFCYEIQIGDFLEPFCTTVTEELTASISGKAKMRLHVEALLGRNLVSEDVEADFDTDDLLGRNVFLDITMQGKDGKEYPRIAAVRALPEEDQELFTASKRFIHKYIEDQRVA